MKTLVVRIAQLCLALLLVGGVALAVAAVVRNSREIARCENLVRRQINEAVQSQRVEAIETVYFPDASRVFGVPEVLEFSDFLFAVDPTVGRRAVGELKGSFDRTTDEIDVAFDFKDGVRNDLRLRQKVGETLPKTAGKARTR